MREKAAVRGVPPLGWKSTADLTKEEWRHLRPIVREHVSPCRSGCPIGTRVEIFLDHVKKGKTKEAFFEIAERNPLPSTTGRVCYRFCEKECTREKFDRSLAIGSLERFVGDSALSERYPLDLPRKGREGKVAVVGSGPAGLSFAYQMRKRGFRVILYDRKGRPGGMLTHIIPEYRLPAGVPAAEITRLLEGGIEFVRREVSPREIPSLAREADALCVATGAWEETPPEGIRPDGRTVVTASSFLEAVRVNPPPLKGKPVAVIGGGNSAVDSARTALRVGGEVTVCYRRREADMPAYREEYEEAVKEGVEFVFCASPLRLERDGEDLRGVWFVRTRMAKSPSGGRPVPVAVPGSEFFVPASLVVVATGGSPRLSIPEEADRSKIVLVGDAVPGATRTVTHAIAAGRREALRILSQWGLVKGDSEGGEPFDPAAVNPDYVVSLPRVRARHLPLEKRRKTFEEVVLPLTPDEAWREALRCLSCGVCNGCDNCRTFCPDGAVRKEGDKYVVDYSVCKGCGICWTECPRGAMRFEEE